MGDLLEIKVKDPPAPHFRAMAHNIEKKLPNSIFKAATLAGGMVGRILQAQGMSELAASFLPATFVRSDEDTVAAGALSDVVYADVQNRGTAHLPGGAIQPKPPRRALAIPLTARAKERYPRDWAKDELALIKTANRKVLLIDAKAQNLRAHYVLVPNTVIKGSRYLDRASKAALPGIQKHIGDTVTLSIREGVFRGVEGEDDEE